MPRRLKILLSAEALEFINSQTKKAKAKIYNNIDKIEAGIVNNELFKK